MKILITGATGQLGSRVLARLRTSEHEVLGISRRGGAHVRPLDLLRAPDLPAAFAGTDAIIHCAQRATKSDTAMALRLARAAKAAKVRHLVAISIVGIDRIPLGFYRQRLIIERILTAEFPRLTIQRATQFHSLPDQLLSSQRRSPLILLPKIRVQPIAIDDVAARLIDLALAEPVGRASDIGGPQVLTMRELFAAWQRATGNRRRGVGLRVPGKTFRAFASGANLAPEARVGTGTFREYLNTTYGSAED